MLAEKRRAWSAKSKIYMKMRSTEFQKKALEEPWVRSRENLLFGWIPAMAFFAVSRMLDLAVEHKEWLKNTFKSLMVGKRGKIVAYREIFLFFLFAWDECTKNKPPTFIFDLHKESIFLKWWYLARFQL
jgi:hypothetical protein